MRQCQIVNGGNGGGGGTHDVVGEFLKNGPALFFGQRSHSWRWRGGGDGDG